MATMSASDFEIWFKDKARDQLRTFDKTITITAWTKASYDGVSSGHYAPPAFVSPVVNPTKNWNLKTVSSSVFNDDLAGNLAAGGVATSQDVAQSIANAVRSAVDKIESTVGNIDARVCHNSCHSNCHGSRGRR